MNKVDFNLFQVSIKPGDLIFTLGESLMSDLVRYGQSIRDPRWGSRLSHVAFIDENYNICESCITKKINFDNIFPFIHPNYTSGIHIRTLDSWKDKGFKYVIVQRLCKKSGERLIDESGISTITKEAKRLQDKKIFYPVMELIGTLFRSFLYFIVKFLRMYRLMDKILSWKNPLDNKKSMYCAAFTNHVYEKAGYRLIPKTVDESVCLVSEVFYNKFNKENFFIIGDKPENK